MVAFAKFVIEQPFLDGKREIQSSRKIMIFVVFVYRFVYSRIIIYRFTTFIYIVLCIGK